MTAPIRELGRYELLERIAEGRTCDVFIANSHGVEGFRRTLVIKRLKPEVASNSAFNDRYLAQSRSLFTLSHANIVQALDLGQEDGVFYMVTELVQGYDLATLREMATAGELTLPAPIGLFLVAEVAKGVEYGHRRLDPATLSPLHLCHGDLHPRNILTGFEGQVKLADFGMVQPFDQLDLSTDVDILRAFSYAAPEVASGAPPTQQSDMFNLGLLTVEICAGSHPYQSPSAEEVRQKAIRGDVPASMISSVPEPVRDLVQSALQKNPARRRLDLALFYDRVISYLHRQYDLTGAGALASFVKDVGDVDLGSSVIDSGMIASEPTVLHRVTGQAVTSEIILPDKEALWAFGSAPKKLSITPPKLRLPEGGEPLGVNGRDAEIDLILEEAARLEDGCRAVLVSGPRGVGKSHLLRQAHHRLTESGYRSVLVAPDTDSANRPYATILDLFALATTKQHLLWLSRPGEALEGALDASGIGDAQSRATVRQLVELDDSESSRELIAIRGLLIGLIDELVVSFGGGTPLILLIDGLELSDILSLELLYALLGANRPGPLLIVIAGLNKSLLNRLGRAATAARRTSVVLPPLSTDALRALVDQVSGEDQDQPFLAATAGSPQAAVELALSQRVEQFDGLRPERLDPVLNALGEPYISILAALAVAEVPVSTTHLSAVLDESSASVKRACQQLEALHLLATDPYGGLVLGPRPFRDNCARLLDEASRNRIRIGLAYQVAKQHRGANALNRPFRARLKAYAGVRSSALAIGRRHADTLVRHGFTDVASTYFDHLAALTDGSILGAPVEALRLRLEQAQVAMAAMRHNQVQQLLAHIPVRAEELGSETILLQSLAQQTRLLLRRGDMQAAESELLRLSSVLDERTPAQVQAVVRLTLGQWHDNRGHLRLARENYGRAFDLLSKIAPRGLDFDEACFNLCVLFVRRLEWQLIATVLDRIRSPREPLASLCRHMSDGLIALRSAEYEIAAEELQVAYDTAHRSGRWAALLAIAPHVIESLVMAGSTDSARGRLNELLEMAARFDDPRAKKHLALLKCFLDALDANSPSSDATRHLDDEAERAESNGDANTAMEAAWLRYLVDEFFQRPGLSTPLALKQAAQLGDLARERQLLAADI